MAKNPHKSPRVDREVEEFRNLMQVPSTFEEGFNLTAFFGTVFIAMIMIPGAIYMGLLAHETNITPAAQWVTVILFLEAARRAQRDLRKAEIYILFFMAGNAMAMPFTGLLWNQYYVTSDAAIAGGIADGIPSWWAPDPETSNSYNLRTFMHWDWLPVIGIVVFQNFFGQLTRTVLGYGLFRLTSDVEKLPFPMAPIQAQGILALAESDEKSWRWRVFSIGGAIGMVFGLVYLGLPVISEVMIGRPISILPIPWSDYTSKTNEMLPAVATGLSWDLGNLLMGMVLPFWAMVGSFVGLCATFLMNPVLYNFRVLKAWQPGDDTIQTMFKNNVDFYLSFSIGIAIAIAFIGFYEVYKSTKERKQAKKEGELVKSMVPEGRGDIRPWAIITCYILVTLAYIGLSGWLIGWHPGVVVVLCFFGFVYTPLISYVTARLEGIAGQIVEIPYIKEASFILSGYKGVKIWFLPVPQQNYGQMTVSYRVAELTGTKFTSIWKAQILLYPIILGASMLFASFIWSLAPVPSASYPYADVMWELQAMNQSIIHSATLGQYSIFEDAFRWSYLGVGAAFGIVLYFVMAFFNAPIFLTYGVVRGLNQSLPHMIIPEFIGALIGKFYFQKKLGLKWRQYIPVVVAGYTAGIGLITLFSVGLKFLSRAAINLPF